MNNPLNNSFFLEPVDQFELLNTISQLNLKKSSSPDDISSKLVSLCSSALTEPLTYIYNLSLYSRTVPHELKIAKVIPIFKKGDVLILSNYRPISLLSVFHNLLEKINYKRIVSFLEKYKILYNYQFGFRSNHSTTLALIEVLDEFYKNLDQQNYVICTFLI